MEPTRTDQDALLAEQQRQIDQHLARAKDELRLAASLQINLLPNAQKFSAINRVRLDDCYQPASDLSGDFFDYQKLPDGRIAIAIGDITGHGLAPALVGIQLGALLHSHLLNGETPAAALAAVNAFMYQTFKREFFMTAAIFTFTPATGAFEIVSAGHCPLVQYHAAAKTCEEFYSRNKPCGVEPVAEYLPIIGELGNDDRMLLYSDGVIDARNPAEEPFGVEALLAAFAAHAAANEARPAAALLQAITAFAEGVKFADDVTIIVAAPKPK